MTRIIYFSRGYTTHDHRFLSAMARTDHKVFFLQLEKEKLPLEDRPLPSEIEIIHWAGGRSSTKLTHGPRLVAGLKSVIRTTKPDLIQAGPIQRSAFLVALAGFRPLLTMSWGYDLLHDAKRNRWWAWATRYTLERSAAMVGDCDTIRQLAIQHGMTPDRIVTFPWGADIRHFTPALNRTTNPIRSRLGWGEDCFVLLSTRNWAPIYGVEDLAQAFVNASRQRPQLRLIMLGDGPLSEKIKRTFTDGDIIDKVYFPGHVSKRELPSFYHAADLYISTSHSDGTSISLLESLACGRPVLLTDIPGNKEWVTPGEQGWLFPNGDADGLKKTILHAVDNRHQLPAMGRTARKLAVERADWDKNFPQLFKAYKIAHMT